MNQDPESLPGDLPGWQIDYRKKLKSAERALRLLRRGQRVFIGSGCGEPQHLVRALENVAGQLADLEILHLLSLGKTSYTEDAFRDKVRLKSFFVASGSRQAVAEGRADYTPIYLYVEIGKSRHLDGFVAYVDPGNREALAVFQKMGYLLQRSCKGEVAKITLHLTQPARQCLTGDTAESVEASDR